MPFHNLAVKLAALVAPLFNVAVARTSHRPVVRVIVGPSKYVFVLPIVTSAVRIPSTSGVDGACGIGQPNNPWFTPLEIPAQRDDVDGLAVVRTRLQDVRRTR